MRTRSHTDVRPLQPAPLEPLTPLSLLELLAIPLLFAILFFGWPLVTHMEAPWWALVGLLFYGGLSAWAIAMQVRARRPTP